MYHHLYWIWLGLMSLITFTVYGLDKSRARKGGRRVPEKNLHWLAILGGFPGGWAGRAAFRHKTRKTSFTLVLLLATVIHLAVIYFLFIR
jgi:uncharacterized membrane protein YsdA (DUF1294 family)